MKKVIGYAVIILPILVVADKWQVWDGGVGALILSLIALLNCLIWGEHCNECKKKERTDEDQ